MSTRFTRWMIVICSTVLASLAARSAEPPVAPCATTAQIEKVREHYAHSPAAAPLIAARELGLPESVVASALPAEYAVGVSGAAFAAVWQELLSLDEVTVVITKAGHVFEIHGPLHPGEPSKKSRYFNLDYEGPGLSGHLRPDLIAAIYAVRLIDPQAKREVRGVTFLDANGDAAFAVYLPGEGEPVSPALAAKFDAAMEKMRGMGKIGCRR